MRLKRFSTAVSPGPSSHRMPFSIVLASILVVLVWVDPVFSGDAGGGIPVERVIDADLLPPPILSLRNEILTRQELLERKIFWEAYYEKHPSSGHALLEIAKAMRYLHEDMDEVREKVRQAVNLEPDNPEALYYLGFFLSMIYDSPDYGKGIAFIEKSMEMDATFPDPHYVLWTHYLKLGKYEEADRQLVQLFEMRAIPSPLLDFAYNLLVSVEKDGILFTNGDNDTYPPVLLQTVKNVRPDVTIVNQSLLHTTWYGAYLRDRYGKLPIRHDDEALDKLMGEVGGKEYGKSMFLHIIEEATKVDRPLYFAVTIADMRGQEGHLTLEGIVYRWNEQAKPQGDGSEIPVDLARCEENIRDAYRLDSMTDWLLDWTRHPAVARLMTNYVALYGKLAQEYCDTGRTAECERMLSRAIRICEHTGEAKFKKGIESFRDEIRSRR